MNQKEKNINKNIKKERGERSSKKIRTAVVVHKTQTKNLKNTIKKIRNNSKELSEAEIYREWMNGEVEEGGSISFVRQCLTYKSERHP